MMARLAPSMMAPYGIQNSCWQVTRPKMNRLPSRSEMTAEGSARGPTRIGFFLFVSAVCAYRAAGTPGRIVARGRRPLVLQEDAGVSHGADSRVLGPLSALDPVLG